MNATPKITIELDRDDVSFLRAIIESHAAATDGNYGDRILQSIDEAVAANWAADADAPKEAKDEV
jgi:hypothetical protein